MYIKSVENTLISTCLTLVTLRPSPVLLRKYEDVVDVFINEKEFTNYFDDQRLLNPVELRTK